MKTVKNSKGDAESLTSSPPLKAASPCSPPTNNANANASEAAPMPSSLPAPMAIAATPKPMSTTPSSSPAAVAVISPPPDEPSASTNDSLIHQSFASTLRSPNSSFVRHQFIRTHRASPYSPKEVLVDSSHKESLAAAEYSHTRASYHLEREARREKDEREPNAARRQKSKPNAATAADPQERGSSSQSGTTATQKKSNLFSFFASVLGRKRDSNSEVVDGANERTGLIAGNPKESSEEQKAKTKNRKKRKNAAETSKSCSNPLGLENDADAEEKTQNDLSSDARSSSAQSAARVDFGTQSMRDRDESVASAEDSYSDGGEDKESVESEEPRQKSTRRFTGYFFADTAEARKKSLTALTLLGIMYCNSIGGGYGLEESIGSGGAFITILGVLVLPLIWALPVSMCVAELATSVPTNGGFLMWINVSMPAPVYFFNVITTLLLMFVDNAVYPVLFSDYLCRAVECTDTMHTVIKMGVLSVTCALNLVGIEAVGFLTVLITLMSVAPFAAMFVIHMVKSEGYVNWDNMKSVPDNIEWVGLIATLAWNVAGMEQAGSLAEDVKDPQKNFMWSIVPLMGLVWLSYIPPIVASVSRTKGPEDWSLWQSGYFATVGEQIGGEGFKVFIVVGGLFSAFGLLLSCLCLSSRTLAGTGEAAAFPRKISNLVYTYNERFGTPHWSILINTFFTGLCAVLLDFSSLVAIDQALYGLRILMIFLACIRLRYAYPHLDRPFKIPISSDGLTALLVVPMIFSLALVVLCAMSTLVTAIAFGVLCVLLSVASYFYCRYFRPHGFDGKIIKVFAVEGLMAGDVLEADAIRAAMAVGGEEAINVSEQREAREEGSDEDDMDSNGVAIPIVTQTRFFTVIEDVEGVAYRG